MTIYVRPSRVMAEHRIYLVSPEYIEGLGYERGDRVIVCHPLIVDEVAEYAEQLAAGTDVDSTLAAIEAMILRRPPPPPEGGTTDG